MTATWGCVALGGTKCTVAIASMPAAHESEPVWLASATLPTAGQPDEMLGQLTATLSAHLSRAGSPPLAGIGIVCGSPLDEQAGLVLGPPNLPDWLRVDVFTPLQTAFGVRPRLMNDANAGVLAEWRWGAARGASTCAFLTFGTGLGAGLIVNGRLHRGARGMAGEIGHWRLAPDGPLGHGKAGSFEGFCSGSGIEWQTGMTARQLGQAADEGDAAAIEAWAEVGRKLGTGLALLIDVLDPDVIVLGGIYPRQAARLARPMTEVIQREALGDAAEACVIVPSALGEQIGEWSALAAALTGPAQDVDGSQH